jgi:hypothetical protein
MSTLALRSRLTSYIGVLPVVGFGRFVHAREDFANLIESRSILWVLIPTSLYERPQSVGYATRSLWSLPI